MLLALLLVGTAVHAADGLSIKGLAAAPDGSLLTGFRNPLVAGKALLVRLSNPGAVVKGSEKAVFGPPVLINLGGRGVRSIDRVHSGHVNVAGPVGDLGSFALFGWSGRATDLPVNTGLSLPDGFSPEALVSLRATITSCC